MNRSSSSKQHHQPRPVVDAWARRLEEFAREADDTGAYEALISAELEAVAACEDGEALWDLAGRDPCASVTHGEDTLPEIIDIVVDHAVSWRAAKDRALAWALAARLTAFEPGKIATRDVELKGEKPDVAHALALCVAEIRAALTDDDAGVRAAAAHALASAASDIAADDARALERAFDAETDSAAAATQLLALASMARLSSTSGGRQMIDATRARANSLATTSSRANSSRAPTLERVVVAVSRALLDGALTRADADALAHAIEDPVPLPAAWGWRWIDGAESTEHLATRVLAWADVEPAARPRVVAALATLAQRKANAPMPHKPHTDWESAMFRIAFGEFDAQPARGWTRAELDDTHRVALRASAKAPPEYTKWLMALGVHSRDEISAFIDGDEGGPFTPVLVGARATHLASLWREVLAGDVDASTAARAIAPLAQNGGMPARASLFRTLTGRRLRLLAGIDRKSERRFVDAMLASLRALAAAGVDLLALARAPRPRGDDVSKASWALAVLVALEAPSSRSNTFVARTLTEEERARTLEGVGFLPGGSVGDLVRVLRTPS